jgi:hypothetical protein
VGSIPVIVKEESVSPDVGGYWTAIPGGIGAGVLLCEVVPGGGPKQKPPVDCSLKITSDYIYRAMDINEVQTAWPANYTLIWTSKNATALNLTHTQRSEKKNLFDNPPVHEDGPLQLPAGEKKYAAPNLTTTDDYTYTLTATGPGGTKECPADLQILAPKNPCLRPS